MPSTGRSPCWPSGGVYNAILLYRALARKSIGRDAEILIGQVAELGKAGKLDAAAASCQGPPYWNTALAQLMAVALTNRSKGLAKIKQVLVMEFHTEVIAGHGKPAVVDRHDRADGPLARLARYGRVDDRRLRPDRRLREGRPRQHLAATTSAWRLWATGSGLLIATPMMIVGNDIHAKLRHLRDQTERQLQDFLEILEELENHGRPASSHSRPARAVLPR